jgi:RNA exonuclease 4
MKIKLENESNKKRNLKTIEKAKKAKEKSRKKSEAEQGDGVLLNLSSYHQNWKPTPKKAPAKPNEPETQNESEKKIWFEVDRIYLNESQTDLNMKSDGKTQPKLTRAVAIDCEMVGVGENGYDSILARVSIVNQYGECLYDKYVIPTETVTDFRTQVSGIRPEHLKKQNNAVLFKTVQQEVADLIKDRVLVGHAVHNDLGVLYLSHSRKKLRDTQKCKVFRRITNTQGGLISLKKLAKTLLGIDIQEGEHNSVHDAQVTMRLYTMYRKQWESELKKRKMGK